MNQLGETLKKFREEKGMNKSQMAKELGVSSQLYGQYEEKGKTPGGDFFIKWKKKFKIDLETLVSHETETVDTVPVEELRVVIEYLQLALKIPTAEISKRLEYEENFIDQLLNEKEVPSDVLHKVRTEFQDVIGNANKSTASGLYTLNRRLKLLSGTGKKRIPFYDAEAVGGITETEMTPIHAPSGTIDIGDLLDDSEAAIRIYGNSMIPNYPPGCVIGLVRNRDSFIEPGEVYVVETRTRRVIKRLFYKNDDPSTNILVCYSDNIMKFEGGPRHGMFAYPPYEIDMNEVVNVFTVTGVIKRNSNSIIIHRKTID